MMRLGIDVDGVLADFITSYVERIIDVVGVDKFGPERPVKWPHWDTDVHLYTKDEVAATWKSIRADNHFWRGLGHYDTTQADLDALEDLSLEDDIYFITARKGAMAKLQTENWLNRVCNPTVLISNEKGLCAEALDLHAYIDDKAENVLDVLLRRGDKTMLYLMDRPWNQGLNSPRVTRVKSVREMLEDLTLWPC